jgi:hypothetical protein
MMLDFRLSSWNLIWNMKVTLYFELFQRIVFEFPTVYVQLSWLCSSVGGATFTNGHRRKWNYTDVYFVGSWKWSNDCTAIVYEWQIWSFVDGVFFEVGSFLMWSLSWHLNENFINNLRKGITAVSLSA